MKEKELRELMEQLAAVEARANALTPLAETAEDSDIEAREAELNQISEERKELEVKITEVRKEIDAAKAVEEGRAKTVKIEGEQRKMEKTLLEIRKSPEYIDAYVEYLKTDDNTALREVLAAGDAEARAVLTNNVSGGEVPIPTYVEDRIMTAWENEEITNLISKTDVKGNLEIGFEVSATDAQDHVEGADAPAEEELHLGVVKLTPGNIKKWITVSDNVMDMKGQAFLDYLYDEIMHKLAKKAADKTVAKIVASPQSYPAVIDDDHPAVPIQDKVVLAPSATTFAVAFAHLCDEARNPVIIMNKLTYATFKGITTADGYPLADPFDGMRVIFNDTLPAYDTATAGQVYAIVGDLATGFRANFPGSRAPKFIFDEYTYAEKDMVKIVGKQYVALEVIAPKRFALVSKPGVSA